MSDSQDELERLLLAHPDWGSPSSDTPLFFTDYSDNVILHLIEKGIGIHTLEFFRLAEDGYHTLVFTFHNADLEQQLPYHEFVQKAAERARLWIKGAVEYEKATHVQFWVLDESRLNELNRGGLQ